MKSQTESTLQNLRKGGKLQLIGWIVIMVTLLTIAWLWSEQLNRYDVSSQLDRALMEAGDEATSIREVVQVKGSLLADAPHASGDEPQVNTDEELAALAAMETMLENDYLKLLFNPQSGEIAITIKNQQYSWFSNPINRTKDTIASPLYKSELSSQIILSYYNEKGQLHRLNSYDESVSKQQLKVEVKDEASAQLKVIYTFGNAPKGDDVIPKAISKERMEQAILEKIADKGERDRFAARYKLDEAAQLYRVRKLQDYVAEEMRTLLSSIGYTAQDARRDEGVEQGEAVATEEKLQFTVPLIYKLDGDQLKIELPMQELAYPELYPIASVEVLPFFGAADQQRNGYMLIPDGSGALIHLNNGKLNAEPYVAPLYGEDETFNVKERWQLNEKLRLPVFGMVQDQRAWTAFIQEGDGIASIMADVSGRNHGYNSAAARFRVLAMDMYSLTAGTKSSSIPMFERKPYSGSLIMRYAFLTGEKANYVGMAEVYRAYLESLGLRKLEAGEAPFVLELTGAIPERKSLFGIPYESSTALTTFAEAEQLVRELHASGVKDIALRYVGWFNDGVQHKRPNRISIDSVLGGERGYKRLLDFARETNVILYPDVAFLQQYERSRATAYLLTQSKARIYAYDPVMRTQDREQLDYTLLAPGELTALEGDYMGAYQKWSSGALSLRDLGDTLYSDFNPSKAVTREAVKQLVQQGLRTAAEQMPKLMMSGGNAYSLPYASMIVHAPEQSSHMNVVDVDVPFYQIVLHGYVDMAGEPFNRGDVEGSRTSLLQAAEFGMNMYVDWFYAAASKVKDTEYEDYMSNHYAYSYQQAVAQYKELQSLQRLTRDQAITGHRILDEGLVWTQYENGVEVLVNYTNKDMTLDKVKVAASSFVIGTGGEDR